MTTAASWLSTPSVTAWAVSSSGGWRRGHHRHREGPLSSGDGVRHCCWAAQRAAHQPQLDHGQRHVDVGAGDLEEGVDRRGGQRVQQPAADDRGHRLGRGPGWMPSTPAYAIGPTESSKGVATARIGAISSAPAGGRVPAKPKRSARLTTPRSGGGTESTGGSRSKGDRGGDLLRHGRRPRGEGAQHLFDVRRPEHQGPAEELRQRHEVELQGRGDAEAALPAAHRPEQLGVALGGDPGRRGHHVDPKDLGTILGGPR